MKLFLLLMFASLTAFAADEAPPAQAPKSATPQAAKRAAAKRPVRVISGKGQTRRQPQRK